MSTTDLSISVAMINYNYGRYLAGALDSVLGQTRPVQQVVIVDDGSTDDSRSVLAGYADEPLVEVVEQDNSGAATASTRAISACTGDVVLLLDSDDLMLPRRAEVVERAYLAHPAAQWVWHSLKHVDRPTMAELTTAPVQKNFVAGPHDHRAAVARGSLPMTAPATSALSWRRPFLQSLMPIPAQMHVHDNYLKHASMGLAAGVVVEEVLTQQGIHDANLTTGVSRRVAQRIRANAGVDLSSALRELSLVTVADRFLAEAVVGSRGGRALTEDRRRALLAHLRTASARERLGFARALGSAGARAAYDASRPVRYAVSDAR